MARKKTRVLVVDGEERNLKLMAAHLTNFGGRILHGSVSHFLKMAERIALTHHESWSGGRTLPGHFDPAVLGAFKETLEDFRALYEQMKD